MSGLGRLIEEVIAYSHSFGLVFRVPDSIHLATHLPVTLRPSDFPRHAFERSVLLARPFNLLVDKLSIDDGFLKSSLEETCAADPFTNKLMELYLRTIPATRNDVRLGIHRSDYMLHAEDNEPMHALSGDSLKQIELNVISCAFGALGNITSNMHRHFAELGMLPGVNPHDLPHTESLHLIAEGLAAACRLDNTDKEPAVVMMIVQPGERNFFDQRHIAYQLWTKFNTRVIRKTLAEIAEQGQFDPKTRVLTVDGFRIGVAYYRAGYKPEDYPTEKEWRARETIELSNAVKCPTLGYQLVGTKKMQQIVASLKVLERYLDEENAGLLMQSFAGLYSLNAHDEETSKVVAMALAEPKKYVLKPQREGGGNNYYEDDLVRMLQTMSKEERSGYILMERIFPPKVVTTMLRDGHARENVECISELGIFSVFLGNVMQQNIMMNHAAGHILRTKSASDNDGGVAAGVAVMDSPHLV